jgi:hypothetical protein
MTGMARPVTAKPLKDDIEEGKAGAASPEDPAQ